MKVIVYGKSSYIGEHIQAYLSQSDGYVVEEIDAKQVAPQDVDFSDVDTIIDVAGIAHIKITASMEDLFYRVNRDLAVVLCRQAKREGVKQFIYLSSMNVYGETAVDVSSIEQAAPSNFYGRSKLEADLAIQEMNDEHFAVVSIRPPVVYGEGCKGNFQLLLKMARFFPILPSKRNVKSMIYIGNLCKFVSEVIMNRDAGVFHPQNRQYTSTVDTLVEIRKAMGKRTFVLPCTGWMIALASRVSRRIRIAFADDYYRMSFSDYRTNAYQKYDFASSIELTVGKANDG